MIKKIKVICLSALCCLLCCCFVNSKVSATSTTQQGIYCYTDRASNFLTFDAGTVPNGNYGGTYKLVSTGTYMTSLGLTQNKTYTVTGASHAKIISQGLPASTATRWTKVSSTHYWLKSNASNYENLCSTYD